MSKLSPAQAKLLRRLKEAPEGILRQSVLKGSQWMTMRSLDRLELLAMKWPLLWITSKGVTAINRAK